MSTAAFVYKAAQEVLQIDTEYDLDTATAGTNQQLHEAGAAAATPSHQREQDQARDNRQDSWEEPVGFGPASCIISTVITAKLHFQIQHGWF